MELPAEILEIIASHLPSNDQYQGLFVCKGWYAPFGRSLYRHIEFKNRPQFKTWLNTSSQHKSLVRSIQFGRHCAKYNQPQEQQQHNVDCATGAMPLSSIEVGVTSKELSTVLEQLPLLEAMQFDSRLWQYLNTKQLEKLARSRLLVLPALDHPRQLSFIQSKRGLLMSSLHLRGSDVFQLHKKGLFLDIFRSTPRLVELTVDADGLGDSKHVMSFSMQDVEALHQSLPHLKRLALVDSVRLMEPSSSSSLDHDDSNQHHPIAPSTRLETLRLHVQIEKYGIHQWLNYMSYKYPLLTDLALHLSSPYQAPRQPLALEHSEKSALAAFTSKLPLLETLAIDPSMSKLYLGDTTIHSLSNNNKRLNRLQVGLWGDNVESTHSALKCVTAISSISHLCIPLWSSEKSIDFSLLSKLHQLTHLDLIDRAGGPQQKQAHSTVGTLFSEQKNHSGYPIDIILTSCPYLADLKLHSGQITSHTYQQQLQPHIHLKSLRMDRVEIYETSDVFHYLSSSCPNLAHVFLRKCISDSFDLALSNLNLTRVVLSELRQYPDQQLDHLTLFQQQRPITDIRLYKSSVHPHTLRPYIRRLKKMQHAHIYLECQSVDQLIFNGCRI
ncbi:hypothetical protein V8B55DRAFT_1479643 [Mucor lusitanicus]|uniref:Uncharacterized protein n=2 Tax=Mucor circinelloides f. lusitanicus TaxID=29924 RepID=A0A168H692_MUCCL|nr:hypothetical protein FB192DRAFT_1377854 [Mucor lusitanicus]OAC98415.1 hypothetical protein MUCCIDRAFT_115325 [Mucor lusitanicus CBS 277.49]